MHAKSLYIIVELKPEQLYSSSTAKYASPPLNIIFVKNGHEIIQMETDKDHVHILLGYSPKVSVSDIVKQLNQYSAYQMWNYCEECLSKQYWKHKILWSDGYFACSIGQVSKEIIEKYIQNQG